MTSNPRSDPANPGRWLASRDLIGLGVGAALLFTLALGARDLWHPNEPTYGQAVAEMAASGERLIPTVNGIPFAEKPILYFWMALLASMALGGVSELSLRLPSAAAGVAAVLMVHALIRPRAGARRARVAALLFATIYIVFWSARSAQMDLLLCATTLGAVWAASRVLDGDLGQRRGWAWAGAAAGLGFLAKGPVGLICPALVVLLYAVASRRARELLRGGVLLGAATFLLVAAPWYVALLARGENAFLYELLYRQNVERFLNPWDHAAPWWYFIETFFLDMAPWAPFVPLAWGLAPADERERALHRLAWVWLAGIVVFFSLSASKRSPYILPTAPAVAILAAAVYERWRDGSLDRPRRTVALCLVVAIALALIGGAVMVTGALDGEPASPPELHRAAVVGALLMAAGGLAILAGAVVRWRSRLGAPLALFGFVVATYVIASVALLPGLDVVKSHRPFCEAIVAHAGPDRPLQGYRLWKWRSAYSFYSGRQVRSLEGPDELREYWNRPDRVFLIVERAMLGEVRATVDTGDPLASRGVGSNFAYLFANRPEGSGNAIRQKVPSTP
jgi:4-amino-4-deoxy-L-arabinose transferase-like glycosyltransferase